MPLFSEAFRAAAARRDVAPIPVFEIAWPSGTHRYSDRPRGFLSGVPAEPMVLDIPSITYDAGLTPGNLTFAEASVVLADKDRRITRILEAGQDPRGSVCAIYWALDGLDSADWHPIFSGIFDREEYQGGGYSIELHLRPNDTPFQGAIPKAQILKAECPLALPDSWGVYLPLLYGDHDASALTGRGMVPCPNINYDVTGWNYVVCLGWAKAVNRVYLNGTLQVLTTDYTIAHPIIGGKQITAILFTGAPGEDAVITADAEGYETAGDGSGELILNPVDQLLHLLANFGFQDHRLGAGEDPADSPIDLASFAVSSAYAARSKFEGGYRLGGSADSQTILDVLQGWLGSELPFRVYPTTLGKLGMRPIDHVWGGYTSPGPAVASGEDALFAREQISEIGASFKPLRDTSSLVRRVDASFIFSAQEGKFFSTLAVQDVSQSEQVGKSFAFDWSAPRIV